MTVTRVTVAEGIELHVEVDGGGPALVLLNGANHNVRQWDSVIGRLNHNYRTIRVDVRGVGLSTAGPAEHNTFEQYADDIMIVCDELNCGRSLLWGTAWGARVALVTAARNPERFNRVVLGDLAIDPADPAAQKAGVVAAKAARADAGIEEVARLDEATRHLDPEATARTMAATRLHPDLMPFVQQLTMPTLIATGDHDANLTSSRRALAGLRHGRLVVIPLSGHAALRQRPDVVVDLVAPFLAEDNDSGQHHDPGHRN